MKQWEGHGQIEVGDLLGPEIIREGIPEVVDETHAEIHTWGL